MGSRVKGNSSVSCLNYSGKRYNDLLELAVIRLGDKDDQGAHPGKISNCAVGRSFEHPT